MIDLLVFLIGAIFGSAANALIDRLPKDKSWVKGRSECDSCKHVLAWQDLIPVLSYLELVVRKFKTKNKLKFWQAGCRYCHSPIPVRNLLVEIFVGTGFVLINHGSLSAASLILSLILWVTTIIAVMDWETKLVSDVMVVVWAGLIIGWQLSGAGLTGGDLSGNIWGGIIGLVLIGGIWAVSRGRAMGLGDVEIAAVMGWWLTWQNMLVALWVGFVTGAAIGVLKVVNKQAKLKSEMAFGPFLILGTWAAFLFGVQMWKMWTGAV